MGASARAPSTSRAASRAGLPIAAAVVSVLVVVCVLVSGAVSGALRAQPPADSADETSLEGAVIVALRTLGQVNAVLPDGEVRVLARGLADPSGVLVLPDATVIVAETGGDRVTGFGGRLGPAPELIASVPQPNGLAVALDGAVLVSGGTTVSRVDVAARAAQPIADGFSSAAGLAMRDGVLYVSDFETGEVTGLDPTTGERLGIIASGLRSPAGVAAASGVPVFASEASGNSIVAIDPAGGTSAPFATVQGPLQMAIDPPNPAGGEWSLVVATVEGLVRLDEDGRVVDRTSLPLTVSASVVPSADATGAGATPPPAPGQTTVLKDDESSSTSPLVLIVALVVALALGAVILTVVLARRASRREQEDEHLLLPEPPAAPTAVVPAYNPCVGEQGAVNHLQDEIRANAARRDEALDRARASAELASRARDRAMRALEVRASVQAARRASPPDGADRLTWAGVSFSTDEGRAAFDSFRRGEIGAAQLRVRFSELGEDHALAQIVEEGRRRMRADPDTPWPEEREAVRDAITARDELRQHEREVDRARADADAFAARHTELEAQLDTARQELEDCLAGRPSGARGPTVPDADVLPRRPRWADEDASTRDDA
jgi:hypothetical protein